MPATQTVKSLAKPLRVWPGIILAIVAIVGRFVIPAVIPNTGILGVLTAAAAAALILAWWLLFSRAPWRERLFAVLLVAVAGYLTTFLVHPSIAGGMMGYMVPMFLLPATVGPLFVAAVALTRHSTSTRRSMTVAAAILLGCGVWTLTRTDGVMGEADPQLGWRWSLTPEQQLLAQTRNETLPAPPPAAPEPVAPAATPDKPAEAVNEKAPTANATVKPAPPAAAAALPIAWAGFRGPKRDSVIDGARLDTNWASAKPVELWRRRVGPAWSSFAVAGDLIFTQEQRGDDEMVSAHKLSTGEPVWRHRDAARFYESNGGPGPRGTPTVHEGRVYTMGATGIVNALDARTGARQWTRNAETDTQAPRPGWGFTASPIVVGDMLVTAASGRLIAYDINTGEPRWTRATGGGGYSSPHLATIAGVQQILLANGGGITSVDLDGNVLWAVKGADAVGIVQPRVLDDGSVLVAPGDAMGGIGLRRLAVTRNADGSWKAEERWTSRGLKPYFNDYVVHEGHVYGFDGTILAAISLETGERVWKGGRYGAGQMLLLADQDLLLVLSEDGDVVLVSATPEKHNEVAKFKAIEGKTWNHPVLLGDRLLVRNGEEMAAFRLPTVSGSR